MNIPNFIQDKMVDEKGYLTSPWQQFFTQLIQELQKNVGQEGFTVSNLSSTHVAALTNANTGTLVYDNTNNLLKVNVNGTFKTVTTS
jgi:hypothetical protein